MSSSPSAAEVRVNISAIDSDKRHRGSTGGLLFLLFIISLPMMIHHREMPRDDYSERKKDARARAR